MLQPPSLKNIPRYPITAGIGLGAIVVTGLLWSGSSLDPFFMTGEIWSKWQLWRAVTAILPHGGFFHLAFNLYWLWAFGTLLEDAYGHVRFAGIVLLLALGSMLAEFMFLNGGIGLSGVGYGLFGLLWMLGKHDMRFFDAVDARTIQLFIIWFFVCIGLTVTNVMPVANIAHGVGAILGILLGLGIAGNARLKLQSIATLIVLLILIVLGSTVYWPEVNFTTNPRDEMERAGVDALSNHDYEQGKKLLERCVQMKGAPARAWYNLGVAYERLHDYARASKAFEHAAEMSDALPQMRAAAESMKLQQMGGGFSTNEIGTGSNTNAQQ